MVEQLIERVKTGSDHAFRIIVETYRDGIFKAVYSVLRDQKEAEDATQEVFVKIYTSLPEYKNQGFKTWITRIAVNHAIDMKRKRDRKKEDIYEDVPEDIDDSVFDSVEVAFLRNERRKQVLQKLDELPEGYREVVYSYYIKEKTIQEIANELEILNKSVEVKLYRARNWMKKHWKEEDFL